MLSMKGLFCDDQVLSIPWHKIVKLTQENLSRKKYALRMRLEERRQAVQETYKHNISFRVIQADVHYPTKLISKLSPLQPF